MNPPLPATALRPTSRRDGKDGSQRWSSWALGGVTVLVMLVVMEFMARLALADVGTTGDRTSYLSRRWYADHPPLINRLGFRERDFSLVPAAGVFRIAAVGDSFTYGAGIEEEERVSNRLESLLNRSGRGRFEVINFGLPGSQYEEHERNMRIALRQASPDFILLQWYHNDLDDPRDPRPRPEQLGSFLHRELNAVSALYFMANSAFSQLQFKAGIVDTDRYYARFLDSSDMLSQRAEARFRRVIDTARQAGVPIAVYLWPDLTRPLGTSPTDALTDRFLAACYAEQIECIDLRETLRAEAKHNRLIVNRFDTHASALANRMASDLIFVRLGKGWIAAN